MPLKPFYLLELAGRKILYQMHILKDGKMQADHT